jgi:hypothetical protein
MLCPLHPRGWLSIWAGAARCEYPDMRSMSKRRLYAHFIRGRDRHLHAYTQPPARACLLTRTLCPYLVFSYGGASVKPLFCPSM